MMLILPFQFHKGTIKTESNSGIGKSEAYFNSIKVRLKLPSGDTETEPTVSFQFHKGTIKTEMNRTLQGKFHYFNSIKVRLKLKSKCWCVGI